MSDTAQSQIYDCLIQDAINFMQSLTEYYGTEQGMVLWNQISDSLGDEVKTEIFMRLLSGGVRKTITLKRSISQNYNAIKVIKAIRQAGALPLKEAKDLWDSTAYSHARFEMDPGQSMKKIDFVNEFRKLGMEAF